MSHNRCIGLIFNWGQQYWLTSIKIHYWVLIKWIVLICRLMFNSCLNGFVSFRFLALNLPVWLINFVQRAFEVWEMILKLILVRSDEMRHKVVINQWSSKSLLSCMMFKMFEECLKDTILTSIHPLTLYFFCLRLWSSSQGKQTQFRLTAKVNWEPQFSSPPSACLWAVGRRQRGIVRESAHRRGREFKLWTEKAQAQGDCCSEATVLTAVPFQSLPI